MGTDAGVEGGEKEFFELVFFDYLMDLLVKTEFVGFKRWLFLQGLTAFLHDL